MAARRCESCGITYPVGVNSCRVCSAPTEPAYGVEPDDDWRAHVDLLLGVSVESDEETQVRKWRYDFLEALGFEGVTLDMLSESPDVDVHVAESLRARGCSVATAALILL